jgi:hypothetical protein
MFSSYHIHTHWEVGTFFKLSTLLQYLLLPKLSAVLLTVHQMLGRILCQ